MSVQWVYMYYLILVSIKYIFIFLWNEFWLLFYNIYFQVINTYVLTVLDENSMFREPKTPMLVVAKASETPTV